MPPLLLLLLLTLLPLLLLQAAVLGVDIWLCKKQGFSRHCCC
jgi:hypothetical protein